MSTDPEKPEPLSDDQLDAVAGGSGLDPRVFSDLDLNTIMATLNGGQDTAEMIAARQAALEAVQAIQKSGAPQTDADIAQLQEIMQKFNETTEALSNWLAKDAASKNAILGNMR